MLLAMACGGTFYDFIFLGLPGKKLNEKILSTYYCSVRTPHFLVWGNMGRVALETLWLQ